MDRKQTHVFGRLALRQQVNTRRMNKIEKWSQRAESLHRSMEKRCCKSGRPSTTCCPAHAAHRMRLIASLNRMHMDPTATNILGLNSTSLNINRSASETPSFAGVGSFALFFGFTGSRYTVHRQKQTICLLSPVAGWLLCPCGTVPPPPPYWDMFCGPSPLP